MAAATMQRLSRLSTRAKWLADADLKAKHQKHHGNASSFLCMLSLAWASIGVIYGDLGTSPLYVFSTIFGSQPTQQDVLCAASLVFWSITLVVLVKYVFIVLLADDNGEGGTFALYATICRACGISAINSGPMPADRQLFEATAAPAAGTPSCSSRQLKVATSQRSTAQRSIKRPADGQQDALDAAGTAQDPSQPRHPQQPPRNLIGAFLHGQLSHNRAAQKVLLGLTLLMTAMVLGDGVLTPAISVLSAVSGLQVKAGLTNAAVIGVTVAILVALFAIQSWGTQRVGVLFAPTVAAFLLSNVLVGLYNICVYEGGGVFRALSPHYIIVWFNNHGSDGWMSMAGVFLCLTGCEAMFADLGHFSRPSIQFSFATVVYPSLILTYLGQASWLLHNLDGYATVFYSSIPSPVFWPMFVVSVLASIVASQALITGAFSMVHQSMALGCFPRFRIHHTSEEVGGQIFIPEVNYTLLVLCVAVVAGFQSGTAIGNAYGIAVNLVMLSTVFLVSLVMLVAWGTHPLLVLAFFLPFAFIEGVFFSANILNIPHGGWFSISLAVVLSAVNVLWIWGTAEKAHAYRREQFQLSDLLTTKLPGNWQGAGFGGSQGWRLFRVSNAAPVHRNPGMALVYSESPLQVPAVFRRLVESWGVHAIVVFLTVRQVPIPHVALSERLLLAPLEFRGFYKCAARYGYMDKVDQGEAFAQTVLDKIAETMPAHAFVDGLVGSRQSSSTLPDCPPPPAALIAAAPPLGAAGGHDGAGAARAVACLLPPSITEESASACNSSAGGTAAAAAATGCLGDRVPPAPPAGAGASVAGGLGKAGGGGGGTSSATIEVSVMCSSRAGSLELLPAGGAAPPLDGDNGDGLPVAATTEPGQGPCEGPGGGGGAAVTAAVQQQQQQHGAGDARPHRRTTWEARRTRDGPAAVSDLAANAVYVLHRSILHVRPDASRPLGAKVRRLLLEHVYQQLWHMTQRFWEGWKVPAARMFEVGMVIEI